MKRRATPLGVLLAYGAASAAAASAQGSADALVERLLEQVGGREVWAAARGFHMVEVLHDAGLPLPAVREYWVDFTSPRIMEKTTTSTARQLQALDGDGGWLLRDGRLDPWPERTVQGWSAFWPGIPTRVFHLLAARDPSVEARLTPGNRLEIFVGGTFAVWIATDERGIPVAYGREAEHTTTHFLGRMESYGPVRLWASAHEPGGLWEVTMVDYELFETAPPVSYRPPRDLSRHEPDRGTGDGP